MHINVTDEECKRCGKCCNKGGPVLHTPDRMLVVNGILSPADLLTIRKGEPGFDPCSNRVVLLEKELIKIRGVSKIGMCKFFDSKRHACSIYDSRPLECKLLKCWDTSELESIFMKDLLQRKDLIPVSTLLFELIENHDRVFDIRKITQGLPNFPGFGSENFSVIERAIREESRFRQEVINGLSLKETDMDFFFGRSLEEVFKVLNP